MMFDKYLIEGENADQEEISTIYVQHVKSYILPPPQSLQPAVLVEDSRTLLPDSTRYNQDTLEREEENQHHFCLTEGQIT